MSVADELRKLADLKAEGLLTEAEFEAQKAVLLAIGRDPSPDVGKHSNGVRRDKGKIAVYIFVAIFMVGLTLFLAVDRSPEARSKAGITRAVNECRKDAERPGNTFSEMSRISVRCRSLEQSFIERYGHAP